MAGKRSVKAKGNTTLDQFFSVKKKLINNENAILSQQSTKPDRKQKETKPEKQQKDPTPSAIEPRKTQQPPPSPLPLHERRRQPLADLGTPQQLTLLPTHKPRSRSFVVLCDDDIQNGITEAQQHKQQEQVLQSKEEKTSIIPSTASQNLTQSRDESYCTQTVPLVDTQDSYALSTASSPVDISSPYSLFDDTHLFSQQQDNFGDTMTNNEDDLGGIEFRLDNDDTSDDDHDRLGNEDEGDNEEEDEDEDENTFFDSLEDPFLTKTYRRPAQFSTPSIRCFNNKRKNGSSFSNTDNEDSKHSHCKSRRLMDTPAEPVKKDDEKKSNNDNNNNADDDDDHTTLDGSDRDESKDLVNAENQENGEQVDDEDGDPDATPAFEFSVSNSVSIPLETTYYEEDDDRDTQQSNKQLQSPSTSISQHSQSPIKHHNNHVSPSPSSSSQSSSPCKSTATVSSAQSTEEATLPMPLSLNESIDIHVAYPVPRGKHVHEKFGL